MRRAILLSKRTSRRIEGKHQIIQLQLHNKINKLRGVTNNKFFYRTQRSYARTKSSNRQS
ncbi:unnamed protein product [Brassica oleracea]